MTINEMKSSFLENHQDGNYLSSTKITYECKLNVFFKYLSDKKNAIDNNFCEILESITHDDVIMSIQYYCCELSNVRHIATIECFVSALKEFFAYIKNEHHISNHYFDSLKERDLLDEKVKKVMIELKLIKTKQKEILTYQAFCRLLKQCNQYIDNISIDDIDFKQLNRTKYKTKVKLFFSSVIVKLIMIAGTKNNVINSIKFNDFEKDLNLLKINSYTFHLPNKLKKNLDKYCEFRKKLVGENKELPLFITIKSSEYGTNYSDMFCVINEVFGNTRAEPVAKYSILNMLIADIRVADIMQLTSFSSPTIEHCIEELNELDRDRLANNRSRYIDSKIRSTELFDML